MQSELLSEITLMTGTMWHEFIHNTLRRLGVPYMAEVNLNPWLPEGWGGTADAFIWVPDMKAFVLRDFKTTKGEGIRYIRRDGAKDDHKKQVSLYYHAAKKMGIPLVKTAEVYYLPKNDTRGKDDIVEPILVDFEPLPARALHSEAKKRKTAVDNYVSVVSSDAAVEEIRPEDMSLEDWLNDELAPVQPREQRVYRDRTTGAWDLKLVPHWTAAFCPFPDELCDCSAHGTTKLGTFDTDGSYYPRKGFEDIQPEVFPGA